MPVRSSISSVLKWPNREAVDATARAWIAQLASAKPDLARLGYFGSYATGDWGVGSDLDLVAIITASPRPFHERGREWDLTALPVPAEILVYTEAEWQDLVARGDRFARVLSTQVVWIHPQT